MGANSHLYDPIKTQALITDSVLVGFSGGKDSAACLDLCFKYFKHVQPYFMFLAPNLEFQERTLRYYEKRYGVDFIRLPHFQVSDFMRYGTFRLPDYDVPIVNISEVYNYLRNLTGIDWIAGGERIADSLTRRAMIKQSSSIDFKRGRFYPLAYWNVNHVRSYNKANRLPLSLENQALGHSFRSLSAGDLFDIRENFPDDYKKIKGMYPLVDVELKWSEFYGKG